MSQDTLLNGRLRRIAAGVATVLAVSLSAAEPASAVDQLGDPVSGEELARSVCIDCHAIDPGSRGQDITGAPAFQDVADMSSATALSLRVFLLSPHMTMPNFALTDQQIDDLIAYIHSLR